MTCPSRLVSPATKILTPLVDKQIRERAAREKISVNRAKTQLVSEKQPPHEFATPEQIGALTVFLCSEAAAQIRGAGLKLCRPFLSINPLP